MVSRLVRHKGAHHLIKAYQGLDTTKQLVIVGESAFTDDYAKEIKRLATGNDGLSSLVYRPAKPYKSYLPMPTALFCHRNRKVYQLPIRGR